MSRAINQSNLNNSLNLIARGLLASLFLSAGITKLFEFQVVVDLVGSIGIPFPALWTSLVIALEILGSLAIIVGYKARVAASILGFFSIITAFLFHNYWAAPLDQQYVQQLLFFKNLSIAGGLFLLSSFNSGKWSIDNRLHHQELNQAPIAG